MLNFKNAAIAVGASLLVATGAQAGSRSINQSQSVRSSTSVVTARETAADNHSTTLTTGSSGVAVDAFNAQARTVGISAGFNANVPVPTRSGAGTGSINQSNGTDSSSSVVNAKSVTATDHSVVATGGSTGVAFDGAYGNFGSIGIQSGFNSYAPQP